ncbi:queuosine precursor transporter [Flavobacteriales bacterium]|nr:queuosine precursor transporter [Flavobacteriales bacterium]
MREQAHTLFLILSGVFIAALVSCNLIFQKFFSWSPFGLYTFEISVGILPYPITFLVTDIISEIYGRKKANKVVLAGLFSSLFVLAIIMAANATQATEWSPIDNDVFSSVFGLTGIAVGASMLAYLLAQFIDIRVFHFWKKLTKGKYLWLRNNASTFTSQLVDTATILILLCLSGSIAWDKFWLLLINGFLFKVIMAMIDTPILYLVIGLIRKRFNLKDGQELEF